MRTVPLVVALLFAVPVASAQGLEIDILEEYLATFDVQEGQPHCARDSGWMVNPADASAVELPTPATNTLLEDHMIWHDETEHGFGHEPTADPADLYGERFITFHREAVEDYDRWRLENGHPPIVPWNPAEPMPDGLDYPFPQRECTGNRNNDPRVPLPTWATLEGGTDKEGLYGYTGLCDFQDLNEFGKAMELPWHDPLHIETGGDFLTANSGRDPAFWSSHRFLMDIVTTWEGECAVADAPATDQGPVKETSFLGLVPLLLGLALAGMRRR